MDRGNVPDSILISYAKKAQDNFGVKYDNNIDFYRLLTRNSKETSPRSISKKTIA
mgnify:CR=1 FL=1